MKLPIELVHLLDITLAVDEYGLAAVARVAKTGKLIEQAGFAIQVPEECVKQIKELC